MRWKGDCVSLLLGAEVTDREEAWGMNAMLGWGPAVRQVGDFVGGREGFLCWRKETWKGGCSVSCIFVPEPLYPLSCSILVVPVAIWLLVGPLSCCVSFLLALEVLEKAVWPLRTAVPAPFIFLCEAASGRLCGYFCEIPLQPITVSSCSGKCAGALKP